METDSRPRLRVAVIGTGISGMSAAWLLSQRHDVTVYERNERMGGHSHTVDVAVGKHITPVDTGFIVYNQTTYPNLTALFELLEVPTAPSCMSFAVSIDGGGLEYSGTGLAGMLVQRRNIFRPRFWRMLADIRRFYQQAAADLAALEATEATLGDYLDRRGYGRAFRDDHLLPMAGAIWSAPPQAMLDYPAASFIRFQANHGLLQIRDRPQWRTVTGGSRSYVERLTARFRHRVKLGVAAKRVRRFGGEVGVVDASSRIQKFDHVVIAAHADEALALLEDASAAERSVLGAFRYSENRAVLHRDASLMPKRRGAWSSWNYIGGRGRDSTCTVTYWMNRLQNLTVPDNLFVTLNPEFEPDPRTVSNIDIYHHPLFDAAAIRAQRRLWSLQGVHNTWFCGSYFGAGFHEDGLQSGLAVAEALGGVDRPWTVADASGRIFTGRERRAPATTGIAA
jgi:predicted NAD/FAD-binding protein